MKVIEFLKRIEQTFNNDKYPSLLDIVEMYKMVPAVRYNKKILKEFMQDTKKIERKIKTAIMLRENFNQYIDFKLFVLNRDSYRSGKFTFFTDSGFLIFNIDDETLADIKKILIRQGYTDEKSFNYMMKKNYLTVLSFFVREMKETLQKRFNTLSRTFSKKEEECIKNILKGKKCNNENKKEKNYFRILVKIDLYRKGVKNV